MNTWRARASGRPVGGREQLHPCRLCSLTPRWSWQRKKKAFCKQTVDRPCRLDEHN